MRHEPRASSPDRLTSQIVLLFEGAIASMLVRHDPVVAMQAHEAALVLIRAACVTVQAKPGVLLARC